MSLPTSSLSNPSPQAGILNNASHVTINNGHFQAIGSQNVNYNTNSRFGLTKLYEASVPEAAYDSSAREYAAKCYPGTREQHIQDFVLWASKANHGRHRQFRMSWMNGPAGVGKSAIAQTCAEKIGNSSLGAAFFFSMPNQRDDPDRFFPSIAYQISTQVKPFADILDEKISTDPSILKKNIKLQFQELIVWPLLELKEQGVEIPERIVIIDGLDECRDDRAQCVIIELIATAIREHGEQLPFLWAFFSRPEPHIVQTFSSETIAPLFWTTTLPVSRELDGEIELYLRGEFENIQKRTRYTTPTSDTVWPSDNDISKLVEKTAGLYVYASTAMKYIGDPDALDPKELLREILSLCPHKPSLANGPSPTADLDSLYTLIMRRIPTHTLPITQQILLLDSDLKIFKYYDGFSTLGEILGLGLSPLVAALSKLHSVLIVPEESLWRLNFHHASFMEFLLNVDRSGPEFCVRQPQHYASLFKRALIFIEGFEASEVPTRPFGRNTTRQNAYLSATIHMIEWIQLASIDEELAILLTGVNFAKHSRYLHVNRAVLEALLEKVPQAHRDPIIKLHKPRHSLLKLLGSSGKRPVTVYVLGQGEKSVRYEFDKDGNMLQPE